MISIPTTLILGAGASMPYGFPSGAQLRQQLCDINFLSPLYESGSQFTRRQVDEFTNAFLKSGVESIDAFLARRGNSPLVSASDTTFADVGKMAIALALTKCEAERNLFSTDNDDGWYQYLWRFIGDSLDAIGENKLSIIAFNYDRSLERYLITVLQNAFGIGEVKAIEYVEKIPIIHVYGKLGELPGMSKSTADIRPYTPDFDMANLRVAASGIKVIAESRDDASSFIKAVEFLNKAERICFLGFGFDQTNVTRLGIKDLLKDKFLRSGFSGPMTYASTLGLKRAERELIIKLLSPDEPNLHTWPQITQNNALHLEATIRDRIFSHSDEKNMNFLRHTGVFHGI